MFGFLVSLVSWIWSGFQAVADYAVIALTYAWKALKAFGLAAWDVAKFTYNDILKPIGEFLNKAYQSLKAFYEKVIQPIQDWVSRVTKALRKIYTTYFQPILSAIDGLRRITELLVLLHVSWAKELDDALAALERKIAAPILDIIKVVNAIDNRIESYVLTVDNLFRKATLIGSIQRDLSSVANMGWNRGLTTITAEQRQGSTGMDDYASVDDHVATFLNVATGQDDAAGVDVEAAIAIFTAYANGETYSMWPTA